MSLRWKDSFILIFGNLLRKYAFLFLRFLFLIGQKIVWKINGTKDIVDRNRNPPNRGDPPVAHRMNIVAWCKGCFIQPGSLRDFILTHNEYVDPMFVTQHDHITLFFIDPQTNLVVFSEALPGQLAWKAKYAPILFESQYYFSQKLIVMQLSEFYKVCDALPDPQKQLIILGNTARCGSTLMTQVFEETGKIVTVSEAYPFSNAQYKFKKEGMTEEVLGLTKALVRFYCRPLRLLPDPAAYVIKPTGPASALAPVFKKLYPDVTIFYLYRNMDSVAKSLYKLSFYLPSMRAGYFFARFSPYMLSQIYKAQSIPPDPKRRVFSNDHTYGLFIGIMATESYIEMYEKDKGIHGLLFDDIIRDKKNAVKAIFKVSNLPENLVEPALGAFFKDSQGNSLISKENFAKVKDLEVSENDRQESNKILEELGFLTIGQETRLPGTLDFETVIEST